MTRLNRTAGNRHHRHRRERRHPYVPGGGLHRAVLDAALQDRLRRLALPDRPLDGDGAHPLHGVQQALRPRRPAVLAGQGRGDRPGRHVDDAHRPDDPRHLPPRRRPGPARRHLPLVHLVRRQPEVAAAVRERAHGGHAEVARRDLSRRSTSASTSSATRSPSPGRTSPTSWARSRPTCPATTATSGACSPTSCRTACPRTSAASSSPATTSPGRRAGPRAPSRPR